MPRFALVDEEWVDRHHYSVYDVDAEDVIPVLASQVRKLYVEPEALRETLQQAAADLDEFLSESMIENLLTRAITAVIPQSTPNPSRPWLDMARNEAAEILSYVIAEEVYGIIVMSKRVRNKETPRLPSRGVDMVGLIANPELRLVCGEVKASSSSASPPSVIATGDDSLHSQLKNLLANDDKILQELNWSHKHAGQEHRPLIGRAMLMLAQGKLPMTSFALLVRPENVYAATDFGVFKEAPSSLNPSTICFCIAKLPINLEDFGRRVYSEAKEAK